MVSCFLFSFCLVNFLYKFHYSYMSFYLYRAVLLTLIFLFLCSVNLLLLYSSLYSLLHSGKVLDNSASIHFHQCCYINILCECGTISYVYYQYIHTQMQVKLGRVLFMSVFLCVVSLSVSIQITVYTFWCHVVSRKWNRKQILVWRDSIDSRQDEWNQLGGILCKTWIVDIREERLCIAWGTWVIFRACGDRVSEIWQAASILSNYSSC